MIARHVGVYIVAAVLVATVTLLVAAAHARIVITGYSSWYGGPCDSQDNDRTASGMPNTVPGFATRRTPFGLWFLVTGPNGQRALGVSLERGPARWTGRVIDLNWSLAERLDYPAPRGCVMGYSNGPVRAEQIARVRYPSCNWAARLAARQLRRVIGPLERRDDCLAGSAAVWMQRFQRWTGRPGSASARVIDLEDWRVLYLAR
jgi:hypothetical protein